MPLRKALVACNGTGAIREQFLAIFESLQYYAVFVLDPSGKVRSWNPGVQSILGYTEAEFIGLDTGIIFTPEDRAAGAHEGEMRQARSEGQAWDMRWHCRKDGSRFWADGLLTAVRDESTGEVSSYIKIMRDATEQKLQQDALKVRERELAEANRIKDVFIATLSHELRNPLNIIMGFTEILKAELDPSQEAQMEAIEAIERSARLQNQLVSDLLDMSRIMSGKFEIEREQLELPPLVESIVAAARVSAQKKGITVQSQIESQCRPISGDSGRLQQVIMNIINNAIKFTPEGGRVEIRLSASETELCLSVKDSGKGISSDFLPYVFERFRQQQGGSSRKYGGLGLGLSIARELVELHGGRVKAESEGEGCGASFMIYLPTL